MHVECVPCYVVKRIAKRSGESKRRVAMGNPSLVRFSRRRAELREREEVPWRFAKHTLTWH